MQPHATDLRDLHAPGGGPSRLTPRRLWLLIQRLPGDAAWRQEFEAVRRAQLPDRIRERAAQYEPKGDA